MRKATLVIGVVAGIAMVLLAGLATSTPTASADNGPHVSSGADATPDKCAGCHRIHTGQNEYLLKEAGSVEDFCYACHGTGGPGSDLAVQEGTFYGGTTPGEPYGGKTASDTVGLRGGGFDEARINTTDPSRSNNPNPAPLPAVTIGVLATKEPVVSQHAVDGTVAGTMWGNGPAGTLGAGPSVTLDCASCHDPHGNGNYRILRSVPTGSGGAGYTIPDTYPKAAANYTTSNYFDMTFTGSTATDNILKDTSAWCAQCHTRYLASRRAPDPTPLDPQNPDASRVDSGDVIFTFRHTSSGYGYSSTGVGSNNTRACITCHTTHGSNASMPGNPTEGTTYSSTVPWPDGSVVNPTNDLQRASMLKMDNRGMCRKCHANQ
jgi:predicted CXXCH cytochrome family protein